MHKSTLFFALVLLQFCGALSAAENSGGAAEYRHWIVEMKSADRGPFERIRWFCNDGSVLPPRAYACSSRGGGHQHGEINNRARELRERGYWIANVLASLDADEWVGSEPFREQLAHVLIEKYLVSADDGWIFRKALFYRGAIQEEDERKAARSLLIEMAGHDYWVGPGYPVLRIAARLLPHGADSASVQRVRQVSASLSDRDDGFKPLRAKIHGAPGAEDAQSVRDYAHGLEDIRRGPYLELAAEIERIYEAEPIDQDLISMAGRYTDTPWLQDMLTSSAALMRADAPAWQRLYASARLLADVRDALPKINIDHIRLDLLDLSLRTELVNFRAASELMASADGTSRLDRVGWLRAAMRAAYGTGMINRRLLTEANRSLNKLSRKPVSLDQYLSELSYLGRAPGWGTQALRMHFFEPMQKLAEIEPLGMLFIQDQLRGSPLLFLSRNLDGLLRDANRLAGVKHRLFEEDIGVGFTALNPGLARGVLQVEPDLGDPENFRSDGIYLLPETVSDLPPVAGILTAGEGNPLSHVQLLARNLGIPNVTVDDSVIPKLAAHNGAQVVLAVSKSGLVELSPWSEQWISVFEQAEGAGSVVIEPDLEKLDLGVRRLLPLDNLRANDSGRVVGPKAAKLGELHSLYPGKVSRGLAIPFGLFKQEVLEQPHPGMSGSVFDWMLDTYQVLSAMPEGSAERSEKAEAFRAELYDIILGTRPGEAFRSALESALMEVFGEDLPGMFIRSDTNVEDLAGFTGAGLNLTLPNVVGFDNLMHGIVKVWASPFTARAFAWRQSHMTAPEHVYTSILLLESVASDKSGVLVTQDIDTGDRDVLSVAVNEGLGGAVDGQAAESLRIPISGAPVRVLATATAPWRRVPNPEGGLQFLPASGRDAVLHSDEIEQLIDLADRLPTTFPPITDDEGNPAPADIEFGFVGGELRLFQVRPFLESKMARGIGYLHEMESRMADLSSVEVDMNGVPGQ